MVYIHNFATSLYRSNQHLFMVYTLLNFPVDLYYYFIDVFNLN